METINIAIEVPQGLNINIAAIKSRITEYAKSLIKSQSSAESAEMANAMKYIESLAVPGGKYIPVEEDSIDSLVCEKYL